MNSFLRPFSLRKLLIPALICMCAGPVHAQSPYSVKEVIIPSSQVTDISIIRTLDGGTMRLLESQDSILPFKHLTLLKLSNAGTVSWYKYLGSTYSYQPADIVQSPDSGYFVCSIYSTSSYTLFKTDKNGVMQFSTRADLPSGYSIYTLAQVKAKNDGGFYIAASILHGMSSVEFWHLLEVSANGNIVSSDCYNMLNGKSRVYDLDTCANGDVLMVGTMLTSNSLHVPVVTRIDTAGAITWSKTYTSGLNAVPVRMICSEGDLIYILEQSALAAGAQTALMKLDGNGNELWTLNYSAVPTPLRPRAMQRTTTGDILIAGEAMFIKTDSAGVPLCARQYPGKTFSSILELSPQLYQFAGLSPQSPGGIIMTTDSCGQTCDDTTLTVIKTPYTVSDSALTGSVQLPVTFQSIAIPEDSTAIQFIEPCAVTGIAPVEHSSFVRLFPNPASGLLTISSSDRLTAIRLLDVSGRILFQKEAGEYEAQLDLSHLPAGYYIVQACFENYIDSQPLIIE